MKLELKTYKLIGLIAVITFLWSTFAGANENSVREGGLVSLKESVLSTLKTNPTLKIHQFNRNSISSGVRQVEGLGLPKLDLSGGYGVDSYSDLGTRASGSDDDFENRGELSLTMTQTLYDGQETDSLVAREKARLSSADYRLFDNAESLALDAVISYMELLKQRELVEIARENVLAHKEILASLEDRLEAGAGSVVDVYQAKSRLARTFSSLESAVRDLRSAEAGFRVVTGTLPCELQFPDKDSGDLPGNMEEIFQVALKENPKLALLAKDIEASVEEVNSKKSNFLPKVSLELSSSYRDKVDSSTSYTFGNSAMVMFRWNLYNGGSDVADKNSALSRKYQAMASRRDQYVRLSNEVVSTWSAYKSSQNQIKSYSDAVKYSGETLSVYIDQFNLGQRSLLDVLDMENENFQSRGQLLTAQVNEVIGSHKIYALCGRLLKHLDVEESSFKGEDVLPSGSLNNVDPGVFDGADLEYIKSISGGETMPPDSVMLESGKKVDSGSIDAVDVDKFIEEDKLEDVKPENKSLSAPVKEDEKDDLIDVYHIVKKGETVFRFVPFKLIPDFVSYNKGVKDASSIYAGQRVVIKLPRSVLEEDYFRPGYSIISEKDQAGNTVYWLVKEDLAIP